VAVLRRDGHHRVATFLLQCLAVADSAVLVVVFVALSLFLGTTSIPGVYVGYTRFAIPYLKKYVNPLGYMTQCVTIWMTVVIAVNRYIAICHPFKAHRLLTISIARIQAVAVFALSILFNVPRFFQYDVVHVNNEDVTNSTVPRKRLTTMGDSKIYDILYLNVFYTAVLLIFPLFVLVVLNAIIIRQLQISKDNMKHNSLHYIGSQEKNITVVIIVIIMIVLLCHTPDRILTVFKAIFKPEDKHCPDPQIFASHFCNLLVVVNSSSNFVVYVIFRKRFRRVLCQFVCRRLDERRRRRRESSGSVRSMSDSNMSAAAAFRTRSMCGSGTAPLLLGVTAPTTPTYELPKSAGRLPLLYVTNSDHTASVQRMQLCMSTAIGGRLSDYGCGAANGTAVRVPPSPDCSGDGLGSETVVAANGDVLQHQQKPATDSSTENVAAAAATLAVSNGRKKTTSEVTFKL
jgi:hypothetical protein